LAAESVELGITLDEHLLNIYNYGYDVALNSDINT